MKHPKNGLYFNFQDGTISNVLNEFTGNMYDLNKISVLIDAISSKQDSGATHFSKNFILVFDQLDNLIKLDSL